jgi:hypothetical protein
VGALERILPLDGLVEGTPSPLLAAAS